MDKCMTCGKIGGHECWCRAKKNERPSDTMNALVRCDHCENEATYWGFNKKSWSTDSQNMCDECAKDPVFYNVHKFDT